MSNEEREFSNEERGNEERALGNEAPDVEAHKRKAFDEPQLEEDDGDDVEAHRRRG